MLTKGFLTIHLTAATHFNIKNLILYDYVLPYLSFDVGQNDD